MNLTEIYAHRCQERIRKANYMSQISTKHCEGNDITATFRGPDGNVLMIGQLHSITVEGTFGSSRR